MKKKNNLIPDNYKQNTHIIGYDLSQVYPMEKIYDPDKHEDPEGYYIPAVDSLVVKSVAGNVKQLYVVLTVDPLTKKSTFGPIDIPITPDDETRILGYGNKICMLYYDNRTEKTLLVIDEKISIYGGNSSEYQLVRITKDGTRVPISLYIDSHGVVKGSLVPIVDSGVPHIKKCLNCHTLYPMIPGEMIILEIYSGAGILLTEINLTSRKALILTDFEKEANPVIGFVATANQNDGSDWVLYQFQNKAALTIWPKLVYHDGTEQLVPIDSQSCFIYGMEEIDTSITDIEYKVMLKYFLSDKMISTIAGSDIDGFLLFEKNLKIVSRVTNTCSKISFIPVWNNTESKWELNYVAYFADKSGYEIIQPSQITYDGVQFNGKLLDAWQTLKIKTPFAVKEGYVEEYGQSFAIFLSSESSTEPYLIGQSKSDPLIYGRDNDGFRRPVIYFDNDLYFISSNLFENEKSFLNNFYYQAAPPIDEEIGKEPPTPTHFTIRNMSDGHVLISDVVKVEKYNTSMTWLTTVSPDEYVGKTVLVEFLKEVGTDVLNYYIQFQYK